jgi:hypothetical protein
VHAVEKDFDKAAQPAVHASGAEIVRRGGAEAGAGARKLTVGKYV